MVDIYVGPDNQHWILHEKLLCHRSAFFRDIFYSADGNTAFGLPDEDEGPFRLFVGWLYSESLPPVKQEADLAPLFDLYLMAEKWAIKPLMTSVLDAVRAWYRDTDTYPGLRRVQYIYANTDPESPMRALLIGAAARGLVLRDTGLPPHWDKALRKNGQLAVDIIVAAQGWRLDPEVVADARAEDVQATVDAAVDSGAIKTEEVTEEKLAKGINGIKVEGLPNGTHNA